MGYLLPAEYAAYGLTAETADAWVTTASAMIEAYCRRPSLLSASYTERMRVPLHAQTVRLSYGPLMSVDAVQAQYARPGMETSFPRTSLSEWICGGVWAAGAVGGGGSVDAGCECADG